MSTTLIFTFTNSYDGSSQEAIARALRPIVSAPVEEYCLALLLQHPELKGNSQDLSPEYFEKSEKMVEEKI